MKNVQPKQLEKQAIVPTHTKAQQAGAEVRQLRACVNDLIGLVALPAIWKGTAPSDIVRTFLDMLLSILDLDFVYLRLKEPVAASPFEAVRIARSHAVNVQLGEIRELLKGWPEGHPQRLPQFVQKPLGDGELSIVPLPLGLSGEVGVLLAGSRRTNFPVQTERLLLSVAANQATIGLQEAWLLNEQKRVADELDRRVAQQTEELAAANKELQNRERRIRRLVDANILAIFIWGLDGAIVEANEAFLHLLQYGREDLVSGRVRWIDLTPPEWREYDEQALAELKATGTVQPYEKEYFRKDGSRVPVLVAGALFEERGDEGVAFALDLSAQKHAEGQLRAAMSERARLSAVRAEIATVLASKNALRGILHGCAETMVRYLDAAFVRIWTLKSGGGELELEASAGMYSRLDGCFSRIAVGQLKIGLIAQERRAHLTNDVQNDPRINDRNWAKAEKMQSFAGYPLLVEDRVVGVMGMFSRQVLTKSTLETLAFIADGIAQGIERKRAEEERERLRQAQRVVVETANDAVVSADESGAIQFANPATVRVFGYYPEELIGKPLTVLMPEYMRKLHENGFRRYLATGQRHLNWQGTELTGLRKNGQEFPVEVAFGELAMKGHRVFTGFIRDISERKRAEEERERLRQAQAELAHINRVSTMGEITASLAHEIKQPISAAVTNAQTCLRFLARDVPDLAEAQEAASRLIKDVTRASEIISRIGSLFQKGILQRGLTDINELIREMIVLLRGEAATNSISIHSDLASGIPQLMADRVQLQQVLMNLMLNGIEAMKGVRSPRRLTITSRQTNDRQLLVSITDTGAGIHPEQAEQIFKVFVTSKPQGTGMGLPISRSIIESHGGRLWTAPSTGQGAVFQFTLPIEVSAR